MVNTYRLGKLLECLSLGNGDCTIACNGARPWIYDCVDSYFSLYWLFVQHLHTVCIYGYGS